MSTSSENPNWPLIAELKPQLRRHVCIYPQVYRGERWYVLRDQSNGRHLRFSAPAYEFIGRLNGSLSVSQALHQSLAMLGEGGLSEDEVILILTQLFSIDVLLSGLPGDAEALFKRFQHERRLRRQSAIMSPLAIRIRLLDPDRLLNRFLPWVRPLFTKAAVVVWVLVFISATLAALVNLPALIAFSDKDIFSVGNLLSMLLVFVVIKAVHEFSHAFAVKIWGGDVHEMGVTILVLAPVPYVDASAAWGFRDKHKRMLVGAVGILMELLLASLALFVWLLVEPGLIKDAAFNALLIGSVSTVLFNANPLLRFDGYYILQDLIEIPNLYTRASRYYLYLIKRYLFGLEEAVSPVTAEGEAFWFSLYGLGAFIYRLVIVVVIVLFLAQEYLVVGIALGCWSFTLQIIMPLVRGARYLYMDPALAGHRVRANTTSVLLIVSVSLVLLFMPIGLSTQVEGVVWVPDQAQVYAGAEGFVTEVLVESGSHVETGTLVVKMHSLPLQAQISTLKGKHRELEIRIAAEKLKAHVQAEILKEEMLTVNAELASLNEQAAALFVYSQAAGTLVFPDAWKLKGRYLKQGQMIAYVLDADRLILRTVVPQSQIGLLRKRVVNVTARFAENLGNSINVDIARMTPAGSITLPSRVLGTAGGGKIPVTQSDESGLSASEKVFQVDLNLPDDFDVGGVGGRAYVSFDHGSEPLVSQWLRSGRQLILSRLSF
ncbi:MAG: HlyD family efflux transporter periplasmic adaptor subunit [Gammaproteobacteria bacterium]|nr:HlyD family efflux transporter periplasmic adaptor subunit [Gammaproteobacteria bacterium]